MRAFAPEFGKLPRPACHAVGERSRLVAQLVINGLGAGAIYAFVALGFALIYNATGVSHLAHGAVFALGGYASIAPSFCSRCRYPSDVL